MKTRITAIVALIILVVLVVWVSLYVMADKTAQNQDSLKAPELTATTTQPEASTTDSTLAPALPLEESGSRVVSIGDSATVGKITIAPEEIVEDSRCPLGVMCIQAGRLRVLAQIAAVSTSTEHIFLLGEPFVFGDTTITMVLAEPLKRKEVSLEPSDYQLTFKVEKQSFIYANASLDLIQVTTPFPGAVVGKQFSVIGRARGVWYFEGSFPIEIDGANGAPIATGVAKASGDWMTNAFVPFTASVTLPDTYTGPATVLLKKDNPSGLPDKDALVAFPVTVEY
jgi:hypothetical protein